MCSAFIEKHVTVLSTIFQKRLIAFYWDHLHTKLLLSWSMLGLAYIIIAPEQCDRWWLEVVLISTGQKNVHNSMSRVASEWGRVSTCSVFTAAVISSCTIFRRIMVNFGGKTFSQTQKNCFIGQNDKNAHGFTNKNKHFYFNTFLSKSFVKSVEFFFYPLSLPPLSFLLSFNRFQPLLQQQFLYENILLSQFW